MDFEVKSMNVQQCETVQEWMSLAQDGLLNGIESRRLHEHLATCAECKAQWDAMMIVSQMFHAAPMVGPSPGFMFRLEAKMAYRQEQRRRAMIILLLAVGAIALLLLALPSIIGLVGATGRLLLPYWLVAYVQGALNWGYMVLRSLSDAAWLLIRNFATTSGGLACISSAVIAAVLFVLWVPLMMGRMATRTVSKQT
jgi:hypothetical protein